MKALTLLQPWASLLAHGEKTIETRSWSTNYRGKVLITASKNLTKANRGIARLPEFEEALVRCGHETPDDLPLGKALGILNLVDVIQTTPRTWTTDKLGDKYDISEQDYLFGDFTVGRYGWVFDGGLWFHEPFYIKGEMGLFNPPEGAGGWEVANLRFTEWEAHRNV